MTRATSSRSARRRHALRLRPRDVGERRALGRGEQLAQREHARQPPFLVGRVDGVHRLALLAPRDHAHAPQRLLHRRGRRRPRRTRSSSGRRRCPDRTGGAASVSRRASAGISSTISSACSSSSSSRTSARSSGSSRVTSAAACSRGHRLEHLGAQLLVEVLEHLRRAIPAAAPRGTPGTCSNGIASATSARSAGCISSVSAAISDGDSSSSAMMSGARRAPSGRSSGLCWAGVMATSSAAYGSGEPVKVGRRDARRHRPDCADHRSA